MTERRHLPAEIVGAQYALGITAPEMPAVGDQGSAMTSSTPVGPDADRLFEEIVSADHVDIVGVLPWQCAARLIEITRERLKEARQVVDPAQVRYFTCSRAQIAVYRHSDVLGTLVQRWLAGITGVRNWIAPRDSTGHDRADHLLYEFQDIYFDCIVHTVHGTEHSVAAFNQLPLLRTTTAEKNSDETALLITRMPEDQVQKFRTYIDALAEQSTALVSRVVLCRRPHDTLPGQVEGQEFRPLVSHLAPYDSRHPVGAVVPVSVIAVCASTAHGPAVLLKRRTKWNSREDFGTISLVSERILEEDFAEALAKPLGRDDSRALDELWLRIGSPDVFEIPERVFRRAAQRELFMSCGLDVQDSRLELRGTCFLDREGEETFLGFYVYIVHLARSTSFDELAHALAWNPDLELVLVANLYDANYRHRLNRLLRRRDTWLREHVFANE
jgi:hypothetical protein